MKLQRPVFTLECNEKLIIHVIKKILLIKPTGIKFKQIFNKAYVDELEYQINR